MRVECCYRLSPHGSVIHDQLDTDTRKLIRNPEILVEGCFNDEVFDAKSYSEELMRDTFAMCEAALLSDKAYVFCKDWNNKQYDCCSKTGVVDCKKVPEDDPYVRYYKYVINIDEYSECGVETTEFVQLRYSTPSIFRIVCKDGFIYTAHGKFKLPKEQYDRLRVFRPDYQIYKLIRDDFEYFGYLFFDTSYGLLKRDPTTGELIVEEVPYGCKV